MVLTRCLLSLGFEIFSENDISEKYAWTTWISQITRQDRWYWLRVRRTRTAQIDCLRPSSNRCSSYRLLEVGCSNLDFEVLLVVYIEWKYLDAGHERAFFQYEAWLLISDHLFIRKVMIENYSLKVLRKINVRMREGFFPFTEPDTNDMECPYAAVRAVECVTVNDGLKLSARWYILIVLSC